MKRIPTPSALLLAHKLIRAEHKRTIPDHRISFELVTPPDKYRVTYTDPMPSALDAEYALVPRLTLTPTQYEAWQAWLDNRYPGGRP